jgi:hypothetical protein
MALPDHPSFPQPPDPSVLAWRYIDTPKLVSLLLRRELHLRRVDLLPDKFEGTHPKLTRGLVLAQLTSPAPQGAGLDRETAERLIPDFVGPDSKFMRSTAYASCWRLGNRESEAMWRLYCGTSEGVALVLPYSRLRASLDDPTTYLGIVTYVDFETEVFSLRNMFNLVMHKRREFEHEDEARLVSWRPPPAKLQPSIALPWAPEEHIQRIVVSPYADAWYLDTIRELVARIAPPLSERIEPSPMGGGPYA